MSTKKNYKPRTEAQKMARRLRDQKRREAMKAAKKPVAKKSAPAKKCCCGKKDADAGERLLDAIYGKTAMMLKKAILMVTEDIMKSCAKLVHLGDPKCEAIHVDIVSKKDLPKYKAAMKKAAKKSSK